MKRSRLRRRSAKMARFYRDVRIPAIRSAVGDGTRPCPVGSPSCTGVVQGIHEIVTRARAGGIIRAHSPENLVPCCHACNGYIHDNPIWATGRGLLRSSNDAGKA